MPLHPEYDAMLKQLAATPGPAIDGMPVADARAMYRMMRPAAPDLAVGEGAGRIDSRSGRRDSDAHLHAERTRAVPDLRLLPRRRLGDRRSRDGRCDRARVLPARRLRRRVGRLSARAGTSVSRGGRRQLRGNEAGSPNNAASLNGDAKQTRASAAKAPAATSRRSSVTSRAIGTVRRSRINCSRIR